MSNFQGISAVSGIWCYILVCSQKSDQAPCAKFTYYNTILLFVYTHTSQLADAYMVIDEGVLLITQNY